MASIVSGPFLAACLVLAIAGIRKLHRPRSAQTALTALRLPSSPVAARAIGVAELAAAVSGIVFGGVAAAGVAVLYLVLTVVALRLLRSAPGTPCGCLGASEAPVSPAHVAVNAAAALVAVGAVSGSSPLRHLPDEPLAAIAFVVLVGCLAHIMSLLVDAQPALRAAIRRGDAR